MTLKYFYVSLKKYSNLFDYSTVVNIEEHKDYIYHLTESFREYHNANKRELKLYSLCICLLMRNFDNLRVDNISEGVYKLNVFYTCTDEILLSDFHTKRKNSIMRYAKDDFLDIIMFSDTLLNTNKSRKKDSIMFFST